jgi:small subunit ribosomal protein S16
MPVKIRLTRQGRRRRSYYHIVVADSRSPRDGRFIENLGNYNPNTNPATIELNFDKALDWVLKGAQPTDTCRAILSYKGVMFKKHLLDGVKKKAFSEEEAESRFSTWLKQKEEKIQSKRDSIERSRDDVNRKRLEAEAKVNDKRAREIAERIAKLAEKESEQQEASATDAVQESAETPVTAPPVEDKKEETSQEAEGHGTVQA